MPMEAAVFRLLFLPFLVTLAEEGGAFCRHARRGNAHASARDASAVVDSPCLAIVEHGIWPLSTFPNKVLRPKFVPV